MSNLQVLLDDDQIGNIFENCAHSIFLAVKPVLRNGAEFSFEVLEEDAAMLKSHLNKQEFFSLDGGPVFFGELNFLKPCKSTDPANAQMRFLPALCGSMKVHRMLDSGASANLRTMRESR